MDRGPIFVAGLERSGTSLLFALLASHPKIAMTRRTNLWTHFYGQYGDLSDDVNFERCLATMLRYRRVRILQPDPERLRREFLAEERTYPRLFALLEEQYAQRLGKPRWGDKSLNTERYADLIFDAYPGARMLHMIRDPRDRFASSLARWKVRRGGAGAGIGEWLESARLASGNQGRFPERYRIVRYEALAAEPEKTVREICEFIAEPYAPEMLAMHGAPVFRGKGSNSSYGRRDPGVISTQSIGRFRDVLTADQIAFIQVVAGARMALFGYARHELHLPFHRWLGIAVGAFPRELARLCAWRAREALRNRKGRPVPTYRLVEPEEAA